MVEKSRVRYGRLEMSSLSFSRMAVYRLKPSYNELLQQTAISFDFIYSKPVLAAFQDFTFSATPPPPISGKFQNFSRVAQSAIFSKLHHRHNQLQKFCHILSV
jgi:hypothetical protein